MTRPEQPKRELQIFRSFARKCPIEIEYGSIVSCSPPHPDIRCISLSGEKIAFEITRLIDPRTLKRIDIQMRIKDEIRRFYLGLSADEKCRFDERYRRASISFDFSPDAGVNQRKKKFRSAFDILLSLRHSFSEFVIKYDSDLMPDLHGIRVKKTTVNGPLFHVSGFGYLADPTRDAILAKFRKKYETESQIELLAYIDWEILPDEEEIKRVARDVCGSIDQSPFRRLWIYNEVKDEILFAFP